MSSSNNSVKKVAQALKKRILRHHMDLVILSLLYNSQDAMGGYDVIKYLHQHFHILPSPGSVYSQLYSLERKGLIKALGNGRKRAYTLTEKGRKYFQMVQECGEYFQKIFSELIFKGGFKYSS